MLLNNQQKTRPAEPRRGLFSALGPACLLPGAQGKVCSIGSSQLRSSESGLCAGGMYHGDMTEKLKLLYKLHLPQGEWTRV